jgi:hypothetical protein
MSKIKLSNGQEVPAIEDLTETEIWDLVFLPIDQETPADVKAYLQRANREFFRRGMQFKPIPFEPVGMPTR